MSNNYKFIKELCISSILLIALVSCGPRGENVSVDQVLKNQQTNYVSQVRDASLDAGISESLEKINGQLDAILQSKTPQAVNDSAREIAEGLSGLITKAGFTSRAALTEIVNQYRVLSAEKDVQAASVKLLVARTYSLMSSEIETTKFAL